MNPCLKWMFVGLCAVLTPACQRYAPRPLDLAAHHDGLARRDPASSEVVAYAQALGDAAVPVRYDPADGLSLAEAELVALVFNPRLRLARLRANVPRAGAAEAGRWEDPELQVDVERVVESVDDPWVIGGMLGFTIPLSGRLAAEREKADAEATAAELQALAEERSVLAEMRAEWANWSTAVERASLARQAVAELDAALGSAERLRQAGELGPLDARLLRTEQVNQTAKLRGYEADAREAELGLKTRMGLVPGAAVKLVPNVAVAEPDHVGDDVATRLAEHPRVRALRAEYEVAERNLKLEIRKQYPDLHLGGGYGTDEGDERVLFGAGLPLPLFNANRRAIAEAAANRDVARAAAEAEYERLTAEAAAARIRLDAARDRLGYVEQALAPLADEQVNDARRLAKLGEFDALVLLEAIQGAHEARLSILEARLAVALAAHRLNALLEGGGISPAQPLGKEQP